MPNLLKSRRFVTAVLAAAVSLVLYFVGKYFATGLEDVQMVINTIMPLALILIAAYTIDDVTLTWANSRVEIEQLNLTRVQAQVDALQAKQGQ